MNYFRATTAVPTAEFCLSHRKSFRTNRRRPRKMARTPSIELALVAAKAIAEGCKQFSLGVAVVISEGVPILVYIPERQCQSCLHCHREGLFGSGLEGADVAIHS